ncbi:hypothetical protein BJ742DRAFT_823905 [Cladochytrium replicatum]|nr:hypothetical protein BJ742DRAFT_823905 [Cladochytrium replicatum]
MDSVQQLFSKQVPVTLKTLSQNAGGSGFSASMMGSPGAGVSPALLQNSLLPNEMRMPITSGEKVQADITVKVSLASKLSGRVKVLEVQLTDESDPYFLYQLEIGEDEFRLLKTEQNLLVDFQQFPWKFVELLEESIACKSEDHPKFLSQLTTDGAARAAFSVIETNSFKHITHLSLQFIPGNDAAVKQYLATLVKSFKAENQSLKAELNSTGTTLSSRLVSAESMVSSMSAELEKLKLSHAEQLGRLRLQHADELARDKESFIREQESILRSIEREKQDLTIKYEDQLKIVTQKLSTLTATHSHLSTHAASMESQLETANRRIDQLLIENREAKLGYDRSGGQLKQLEKELGELDQENKRLTQQLRESELREREREDQLRSSQDAFRSFQEQKDKMEQTIEVLRTQSHRLDDSLKSATEEINKGNDIIRRLQSELKSAKSKIKLKNIVTLQQEKLLDERGTLVESAQKEFASLKEELVKKQEILEENQKKLDDRTAKLEESKKIIEDNNHVIEWLHKQLNEDAVNRPLSSITRTLGTLDFDKYAGNQSSPEGEYKPGVLRSRYGIGNIAEPYARPAGLSSLPVPSSGPVYRGVNSSPVSGDRREGGLAGSAGLSSSFSGGGGTTSGLTSSLRQNIDPATQPSSTGAGRPTSLYSVSKDPPRLRYSGNTATSTAFDQGGGGSSIGRRFELKETTLADSYDDKTGRNTASKSGVGAKGEGAASAYFK